MKILKIQFKTRHKITFANKLAAVACLFFTATNTFGQAGEIKIPSSPSASSFATYVSIPPANASGIPEIAYPLMTLPTKSKDVVFNFSLQYHPNNISLEHEATNVGLGWSLFGGAIISRKVNYSFDETGNDSPQGHSYDDEYFYNFFGYSGRFQFKRKIPNNGQASNFVISHGNKNPIKIEFTNTASQGVFITSFTITDDKGIRYIFDQADIFYTESHMAYHLTKVIDQGNNIIATLEYERTIPARNNLEIIRYTHTLKKINAIGVGSIDFSLGTDQSLRQTRNDMVQINSMQMKNFRGEIIRTCKLEYVMRSHMPDFYMATSTGTVRFLKKMTFYDSGNLPIENYDFSYIHHSHPPFALGQIDGSSFDDYGFTKYGDGSTPENGRNGVLANVTLPSGGKIVYDFGGNRVHAAYTDNEFYFSGPEGDQFFNESTDFPGQLESNTVINTSGYLGYSPKTYIGNQSGYRVGYGAGLRINNIHYYNAAGALIPEKTVNYDYRDFNFPQYDSGQMIIEEIMDHVFTAGRVTYATRVYYKNVKVTIGSGNGYTKYCYYTPYDTMKNGWGYARPFGNLERFVWSAFSLLNESPLKYSEIYSEDNNLLQRNKYYYSIGQIASPSASNFHLRWNDNQYFGEYLNNIYHRYVVSEKFSYSPNSVITERSFTRFNWKTFQIESESKFNTKSIQNSQPGASVKETQTLVKYLYPEDLPNEPSAADLIAKNIISVPMKTEYYTNDNVKLSSQKTVFKNWGNGWITPETVESSKGADLEEAGAKILKIDPMTGNPEDVENEDGTRTSYIWGYNGTLLLAKIENMSYSNIPLSLLQQVKQLSSSAAPNPNLEQLLLSYLNSIRKSSQLTLSLMTSYTHKPLVGVSTITDPRGNTIYYSYDAFGRLSSVRDSKGNLVSENKYRLKTQN